MKVAIVLSIVILLAGVSINFDRYQSLLELKKDYNMTSEEGRIAVWTAGVRIMLSRPLTGVGASCFSEALANDRMERGLPVARWQTAHNSFVQVGAETGVLGLFLFAAMSLRSMMIFWRVKRHAIDEDLARIGEAALVAYVGYFVAAMFLSQAYSVYWAFFLALSTILSRLLARETAREDIPEQASGHRHARMTGQVA